MTARFFSSSFRRDQDVDFSHMRGGGTRRPHTQPVPQLLQKQQRQRDGGHPGALQRRPDVAGPGERHLQVGSGSERWRAPRVTPTRGSRNLC